MLDFRLSPHRLQRGPLTRGFRSRLLPSSNLKERDERHGGPHRLRIRYWSCLCCLQVAQRTQYALSNLERRS